MAKEFLQSLQDLPVYVHKQNSNVIFAIFHQCSYVSLLKQSSGILAAGWVD